MASIEAMARTAESTASARTAARIGPLSRICSGASAADERVEQRHAPRAARAPEAVDAGLQQLAAEIVVERIGEPPDLGALEARRSRRGCAAARSYRPGAKSLAATASTCRTSRPAARLEERRARRVVDVDLEAQQLGRDAPREVAVRRDDADATPVGDGIARRERDRPRLAFLGAGDEEA